MYFDTHLPDPKYEGGVVTLTSNHFSQWKSILSEIETFEG